MTERYQANDEPVPGLRLIKFLGQGGIGAVWKATAPGGTEVALKFISLGATRGLKEFTSLRLIKHLRHPNLVPLIAYWLRDSQGNLIQQDTADVDELKRLVTPISPLQATVELDAETAVRPVELIVEMGLGDRDLSHRLNECRQQGLPGIPVDELLGYMEEAAKAIDFLNAPRHDLGSGPVGIQHCDIKPYNIMLVGGAVQVCDFGLARVVGDIRATSTSSGTIAYVAPECLTANEPSSATDQYSLAVTYFELRTGRLPYHSEGFADVMKAVLNGQLELSALPENERAVIRRATSLDPGKRFATTMELVQALRRAVSSGPTDLPAAGTDIRQTIDERVLDTRPSLAKAESLAPPPVVAATEPAVQPQQPPATTIAPRSPKNRILGIGIGAVLLIGGLIAGALWQSNHAVTLSTAKQHFDRHEFAQAIALLDEIIKTDGPEATEAYLLRGTAHLEQKDTLKAVDDLTEVIRRDQREYRAYSRRAKARFDVGDVEGAVEDYSKALEISPGAEDYHARGLALAQLKKYQEAIDDFTAALRHSPANAADIYQVRSAVATEAGQDAVAQRDQQAWSMLDAHAAAKTDAQWYAKLAEILAVDRSDSKLLISRAIALAESIAKDSNFEHPAQLDLLAMLEAANGNYARAETLAKQALDKAETADKPAIEKRLALYRQQRPYVRNGM